MIEKKTIEYVDFIEVQKEIAKEMSIESFRDWQVNDEIIDLYYKWKEYVEYRCEGIRKVTLSEWEVEWTEQDMIRKDKLYLFPFIKAAYKVIQENNIKYIKYY